MARSAELSNQLLLQTKSAVISGNSYTHRLSDSLRLVHCLLRRDSQAVHSCSHPVTVTKDCRSRHTSTLAPAATPSGAVAASVPPSSSNSQAALVRSTHSRTPRAL